MLLCVARFPITDGTALRSNLPLDKVEENENREERELTDITSFSCYLCEHYKSRS